MLRFVVLTLILAIAESGDIDAYLGKTLSVAAFPKVKNVNIGCNWYTARLVNVRCACGNDTETIHAKLLSYKYVPDNGTEALFAVSVVNTAAEVVDALMKYKSCKCDENTYRYGVYRPVNDKFYVQYVLFPVKDEPIAAVLAARSKTTKNEIEETIQLIDDLKTRKYGLLCD